MQSLAIRQPPTPRLEGTHDPAGRSPGGERARRRDSAPGEPVRAEILAAAVREVASRGYADATVMSIASSAGVTRAAFYGLFANKEQCALEAFRVAAARVNEQVAQALDGCPPTDADGRLLDAIVELARGEPEQFMFLTHGAMTGGHRLLELRTALVCELASRLESRRSDAPEDEPIPDLPALLVLGGVIRILGMALRRERPEWGRVAVEVRGWIDCYRVPSRLRRWKDLEPDALAIRAAATRAQMGVAPPQRPIRGVEGIPPDIGAKVQREQIVHATAAVVSATGYPDAKVAEIVAAAGVSREAFYRHFDGKQDAVDAAATLLFERCMAAMGGVYFASGKSWPERVWDSGSALTSVLAGAPSFTHLALIDSYAPDPASARRTDELLLSFTIFLADGVALRPDKRPPAKMIPQAITAAMVEMGALCASRGETAAMGGLVPLGVILTIAPYTGIEQANELVERLRAAAGIRLG